MALALTKFSAYGFLIDSTNSKRGKQRAMMTITGLNTDLSWDISNLTGTFWTAAKANATYGGIATKAAEVITQIQTNATVLSLVGGTIENTRSETAQGGTIKTYLSNAATGGALSEALVVTGLLATDTVLGVTANTAVAATEPNIVMFDSAASVGGAATEALVVTGLLATDTIVSITQKTAGANGTSLVSYSTLINDGITAGWTANPGAGAVITVAVKRTIATGGAAVTGYSALGANALTVNFDRLLPAGSKVLVTVQRGDSGAARFTQSVTSNLPSFTFDTASAPTSAVVILEWEMNPLTMFVNADLG